MDNYITKKRFDALMKEVKQIREVELPAVSKSKLLAAQEGDLKENGGYHAAKERMELLMKRLEEYEGYVSGPTFIDDLPVKADMVTLGTVVKVLDLQTNKESKYSILGVADSDPENNVISFQTPIARGMIRKKSGEVCEIPTPKGIKKFKILHISKYSA